MTPQQKAACAEIGRIVNSLPELAQTAGVIVEVNVRPAQGIEAGTAETVKQGSVHESPVGNADAPTSGSDTPNDQ